MVLPRVPAARLTADCRRAGGVPMRERPARRPGRFTTIRAMEPWAHEFRGRFEDTVFESEALRGAT